MRHRSATALATFALLSIGPTRNHCAAQPDSVPTKIRPTTLAAHTSASLSRSADLPFYRLSDYLTTEGIIHGEIPFLVRFKPEDDRLVPGISIRREFVHDLSSTSTRYGDYFITQAAIEVRRIEDAAAEEQLEITAPLPPCLELLDGGRLKLHSQPERIFTIVRQRSFKNGCTFTLSDDPAFDLQRFQHEEQVDVTEYEFLLLEVPTHDRFLTLERSSEGYTYEFEIFDRLGTLTYKEAPSANVVRMKVDHDDRMVCIESSQTNHTMRATLIGTDGHVQHELPLVERDEPEIQRLRGEQSPILISDPQGLRLLKVDANQLCMTGAVDYAQLFAETGHNTTYQAYELLSGPKDKFLLQTINADTPTSAAMRVEQRWILLDDKLRLLKNELLALNHAERYALYNSRRPIGFITPTTIVFVERDLLGYHILDGDKLYAWLYDAQHDRLLGKILVADDSRSRTASLMVRPNRIVLTIPCTPDDHRHNDVHALEIDGCPE